VLSKEVVNRWQSLVDDHRVYRDRLNEIEAWLSPLEARLANLRGTVAAESAVAAAELQSLLAEREQAETKLAGLCSSGERLLSDTAAPGRERIRQQMRNIRDRCVSCEILINSKRPLRLWYLRIYPRSKVAKFTRTLNHV